MSLDWSEFFTRLGGGLETYGKYKEAEKTSDEERQYRASELALRQSEADSNSRYRSDALAATERQRLQDAAQHRGDLLGKAGIIAPESYTKNAMAAEIPETPGYDVGGMVLNAVRQHGQARTQEFEQAAPAAANEAYNNRELMHPIQGGGYAFIEPGVRSNLDVAASNANVAAENRKTSREVALIRAAGASRNRGDPMEMKRIQFMQKGISDRMKPPVNPVTGLPTGQAMGEAQAYRETKGEWERIKNNLDVPEGSGQGKPVMPSDSFSHGESNFDPMAVADQLKGIDEDTARQILEANDYTDDEIEQVLGQ